MSWVEVSGIDPRVQLFVWRHVKYKEKNVNLIESCWCSYIRGRDNSIRVAMGWMFRVRFPTTHRPTWTSALFRWRQTHGYKLWSDERRNTRSSRKFPQVFSDARCCINYIDYVGPQRRTVLDYKTEVCASKNSWPILRHQPSTFVVGTEENYVNLQSELPSFTSRTEQECQPQDRYKRRV